MYSSRPLIFAVIAIFVLFVSFTYVNQSTNKISFKVYHLNGQVLKQDGTPLVGAEVGFYLTKDDLSKDSPIDSEITGTGFSLAYPHNHANDIQKTASIFNQVAIKGILQLQDPVKNRFPTKTILTFDGIKNTPSKTIPST